MRIQRIHIPFTQILQLLNVTFISFFPLSINIHFFSEPLENKLQTGWPFTPKYFSVQFFFLKNVFLPFLGLLPRHMEVPRLGVSSEL